MASGADINAREVNGNTPLHLAVRFAEGPWIIELLLDHGADIEARGERRCTPLSLAVGTNKYLWVIELLLGRGADVNAKGENDMTPLHWAAAFSQNLAVIELLLNSGAETMNKGRSWKPAVPVSSTKPCACRYTRPGSHRATSLVGLCYFHCPNSLSAATDTRLKI